MREWSAADGKAADAQAAADASCDSRTCSMDGSSIYHPSAVSAAMPCNNHMECVAAYSM